MTSSTLQTILADTETDISVLLPIAEDVAAAFPGAEAIVQIFAVIAKLAGDMPNVINLVETGINLVQSGKAPSAAQQAAIDSALSVAHLKVQNAASPAPVTPTP